MKFYSFDGPYYEADGIAVPQDVQNVLDACYRRYAMKQAQAHPMAKHGMFGPFPASFMLCPEHGCIIMSALLDVGAFN